MHSPREADGFVNLTCYTEYTIRDFDIDNLEYSHFFTRDNMERGRIQPPR